VARLTARDFKRTRRGGLDLARHREFLSGVGVGLALALGVFLVMSRAAPDEPRAELSPKPEPRAGRGDGPAAAAVEAVEEGSRNYDFYEMLPKFEVVVPEAERDVKRDVPAARVERPGVYVLQVGSYRRVEDADRVRAQLALQGLEAAVQRVAVDADVWHRVRIGPIADLAELNRTRDRLRAGDVDALVIRVGD
jgi:cell division protein FtsN